MKKNERSFDIFITIKERDGFGLKRKEMRERCERNLYTSCQNSLIATLNLQIVVENSKKIQGCGEEGRPRKNPERERELKKISNSRDS